jgi:hypothetical protein
VKIEPQTFHDTHLKRFPIRAHYRLVMQNLSAWKLSFADLLIASLVVWRLTHLLWGEDGPWDVFIRLRKLAGASIAGQILDCFYCLSLWIAAPFAYWVGGTWPDRGVAWPAISAAAILLERITSPRSLNAAPAVWREDSEAPSE